MNRLEREPFEAPSSSLFISLPRNRDDAAVNLCQGMGRTRTAPLRIATPVHVDGYSLTFGRRGALKRLTNTPDEDSLEVSTVWISHRFSPRVLQRNRKEVI